VTEFIIFIIAVVALIIAILAYRRSGTTEGLNKKGDETLMDSLTHTLREKTANTLSKMEKAVREEEKNKQKAAQETEGKSEEKTDF